MQLQIFYDKKHWYTAMINELWIVTEWDNFDELMYNINEALELNRDDKFITNISSTFFQFNLFSNSYATNLQTSYQNS